MPLRGANRQRPTNRKGVDVIKVSGIYRIDLGNGYFYIGCSSDLEQRSYMHLYELRSLRHKNIRMQKCWNKYQVFDFVILEICDVDNLTNREQFYLDKYFCDKKNVNILPVAGRPPSITEELKDKIRSANRRRIYTPEMRVEISRRHTGRIKSPETCARLSASLRGKPKSAEHRIKLSMAAKNRAPYSDEYKKKMSMVTKGKPKSAETRQKMRDAWVLRRAKKKANEPNQ